MQIVLFEDAAVEKLAPITLTRPAFAISCGGSRLIELIVPVFGDPIALVRAHLADLQGEDESTLGRELIEVDRPALFVNARLVPSIQNLNRLAALAGRHENDCIVRHGDSIVAAKIRSSLKTFGNEFASSDNFAQSDVQDIVARLTDCKHVAAVDIEFQLFEYPHDVIRHLVLIVLENLNHRAAQGRYTQQRDGLFVGDGVALGEHVVTDTRNGPIIIDTGATIGPFCYLKGPLYIGRNARVNEHSSLKDGTCIGHTTKVGGEVECSIIEPYSNKQHHGFLGHSYIGSWINLGAGTSNSDLKNTYGPVNMQYGDRKVSTGMQFVGCIVGDYAKTAINTSIFTGKTIGVGSMVYGFVTGNVPSFVNYARSFGHVTEASVESLIATQSRMFARRGLSPRACDVKLLRDVFAMTRPERADFGELPSEPIAW